MSAGSVFNWNAEVGLTRLKNATPQTDDAREVPGESKYVLEVNAGFARRHAWNAL